MTLVAAASPDSAAERESDSNWIGDDNAWVEAGSGSRVAVIPGQLYSVGFDHPMT